MKTHKKQQLALRKKAISNLDQFLLGGRNTTHQSTVTNPQTPTALTACHNHCPSDVPEPTRKGC